VLEGGGERRHGGVTRRRLGFGWLAGDGRDRRVAGCWRQREGGGQQRGESESKTMLPDTWQATCGDRALHEHSTHHSIG
jgi:hypothetical protein